MRSVNFAAAVAWDDFANEESGFSDSFEIGKDGVGAFGGHNRNQSDSHVEYGEHFFLRHSASFLDEGEDGRDFPAFFGDLRGGVERQKARQIANEPAAGDVSKAFDSLWGAGRIEAGEQFANWFEVRAMNAEQFVGEAAPKFFDPAVGAQFHFFEENLASERVAVCMQAVGGKTDEEVSGANGFAIRDCGFFRNADNGAAEVVFFVLVEARHLGGFAADQSATVGPASVGEADNNLFKHGRLETAGAKIVEKEQRFGAENGNVVDAVVDEVFANRVVPIDGEGRFEFCSNAVHAGNENWPAKMLCG